jgi:hypothetical protein
MILPFAGPSAGRPPDDRSYAVPQGSFRHLVAILRDPDDMIPMVKNGVTSRQGDSVKAREQSNTGFLSSGTYEANHDAASNARFFEWSNRPVGPIKISDARFVAPATGPAPRRDRPYRPHSVLARPIPR